MTPANLLPALALVALAMLARRHLGSWFAPGAFFALFWTVAVWVPLLFAPDTQVMPSGLWWIFASALAVYLGTAAGVALFGRRPERPQVDFRWPGLRTAVACFSIAGFGAPISILASRGYSVLVFLSPTKLADVEREFSVARYIQGETEPTIERAFLVSIYLAALLGGLLLADRRAGRWRWLALLPLLPGTAVAAVETTRSSIYFPIVLMACSFLVAELLLRRRLTVLLTPRRVVGAILLGVVVVPVSLWLQLSRYGYDINNGYQVQDVVDRFRLGSFGYLSVFTNWFDAAGLSSHDLSYGALSFAGVFDALGIQQRLVGLYSQSLFVGDSGGASNIYTIFRGLIEDFSPSGSLVLLVMIGIVAGFAYAGVQRGDLPLAPFLAAFYAATAWSFVVDIFVYNTILLGGFLFAVYIVAVAHRATHVDAATGYDGVMPEHQPNVVVTT